MKLAVPCFFGNKIYTDCEIQRPKGKVIAQTQEQENVFAQIHEFVSGSITCYTDSDGNIIDDKSSIRNITKSMPYITSETVALKIMCFVNGDDAIESVSDCPRCGTQIIKEQTESFDSRDKLDDLKIYIMQSYSETFHIDLEQSVKIKNKKTDETLFEINNIEFKYPTLEDCIVAQNKYGNKQAIKRQFAIYANCIKSYNGIDIDNVWRGMYGDFIITEMDSLDIAKISRELKRYGLQKTVTRNCPKCGKVYEVPIDTSNFFASGLQSI